MQRHLVEEAGRGVVEHGFAAGVPIDEGRGLFGEDPVGSGGYRSDAPASAVLRAGLVIEHSESPVSSNCDHNASGKWRLSTLSGAVSLQGTASPG
jgi:hypothetical protein